MTDYKNPRLLIERSAIQSGKVSWRSPSNLAIIKYWGKYGIQLPKNPSISFTLDEAYTETTIQYSKRTGSSEGTGIRFLFDGQPNPLFEEKITKFLNGLMDIFPFLRQLNLQINSHNSFPHSSGIASSASAMSALALCLCSLEDQFFNTLTDDEAFRKKASYIARLGSGSACRSIYPSMAVWGESGEVESSSNLYAIPFEAQIHEVFKSFHDDILIISKDKKSVSSSAGHGLMNQNIYADNRYKQARQRFHNVLIALKKGDIEAFGTTAENEALTLHALMMTSSPPYILMKPNTLLAIEKIRNFRKTTKLPLYFSLDAGPNLHLLYPDAEADKIKLFIEESLKPLCQDQLIIKDKVGLGPLEI